MPLSSSDTESQLRILIADREKSSSLSKKVEVKNWSDNGSFCFEADFKTFKISSKREELDGVATELLFSNGDKIFNLFSILPEGWKLKLDSYPIGKFNPESKLITFPKPITLGKLLSGLHEVGHVLYREKLSVDQLINSNSARTSLNEKVNGKGKQLTAGELALIIDEEKAAWEIAKKILRDAGEALGVDILKDVDEVDNYIGRRIENYMEI